MRPPGGPVLTCSAGRSSWEGHTAASVRGRQPEEASTGSLIQHTCTDDKAKQIGNFPLRVGGINVKKGKKKQDQSRFRGQ